MHREYSRFKTILASILISCIVLNLFPLSLLALDTPCYSVSDEYEFSVTRVITSRWEDHANIDFIITNNGNTTINNWYITTDLPYEVENIWNASIAEISDRYITISSAPQNQPIEPGCSVTFGITGYSEDDSLFDVESSFYLLNIEDVIIPVEKYQATTNIYSTTETGFSGAIAITNISSELLTIENIVLNSTNGLTINGNASIEDETTLVVDSNSRNIYPNASIYINFEGTNEIPEVLELRYTGLAFTLTEDEDNDGILDIDEFLYPEEEPEVTPTPTIAPTNTPEVEPTETPTVTPEVDEPAPSPEIAEEYLYQDDDSDGLINGYELRLGYDVNSPDTDGDGIFDIDEDFDLDGLTNGEEINLELNPASNDTDLDLLLDYVEIYVYETNPSLYDTDGDSVSDYDEIFLGKNPLTNDIDVLISQEKSLELISDELNAVNLATVNIDLADNISHQLQIRNVYNVDMYTSAIESLVGCPIDITCDEEFTEATITFTYVPELLDCSPEDLGILWYDEEHGFYIEQDSVLDVENNTISTTVNHFSTYALVNINEWWNAFDVPEASNGYLVVEYSTSYFVMGGLTNEDKIEAAYTVDEYEQRCFNMWANSAGNYRRNYELVSRISGNRTQVDSMQFEHDYVWLIQDVTDRDNDGLYDCFEIEGMLLSNGTTSYSSTNNDDSDGDGISDLEEAGIRYRISRDEDGRITISVNGEIVLSDVYYIDSSSPYFFLAEQIPPAGIAYRSIWVPLSNPNHPDSDEDGVLDYEDATPLKTNGPISYLILTFEEPTEEEAAQMSEDDLDHIRAVTMLREPYERALEENGLEYVTYTLTSYNDFRIFWQNMNRTNANPDELIACSEVQELIIVAHGCPDGLAFQRGSFGFVENNNYLDPNSNRYIGQPPCLINNLDLQACYCGANRGEGLSFACEILTYTNRINNVYAYDGPSSYSSEMNSNISCETIFGIIPNPGRYVCFYLDANGEIQEENLGVVSSLLERR